MNPIRKRAKKPVDLCKAVRTRLNLMSAWRHVEKRVAASKDKDTQKALAKFRENPTREIAAISRRLGNGSFIFEPQRGYPKARKGKLPRPIVVAPIVNRVVQRAILDVCQNESAKVRAALGGLPEVIACSTSVGGLPGRGVPEAIQKIRSAIDAGSKWYVRSDLVNFFTRIPKPIIEAFLRANVADTAFVDLFMNALATELANEADIRKDLDLFPLGDEGIPQGSALSALCANIVLSEFDRALNGRGVTTIRYLDDFVILAPSKTAVDKAWAKALELLTRVGLEAHNPLTAIGKASRGEIMHGFDFLSFRIDDKTAAPTPEARLKFIEGIKTVIRHAKRDIQSAGAQPRRAQPMFIQTLALLDKKARGWGDAFRSTTQRLIFAQMDDQLDKLINDFIAWFGRHSKALNRKTRLRKMGIALLSDTPAATAIETRPASC
jgi:hypothetical protein